MNHIMVTGATGFIGSSLVRRLIKDGVEVTALVRDVTKAKVCIRGVKDQSIFYYVWDNSVSALAEYMKEKQVDCVVHLATRYITRSSWEDIDDLVESNITFGMKILEAMRIAGVRNMVNSSTSWQHYQNEPYNPVNIYAATKQAYEDILKYYTDAEGIRTIILEIYDTYGPFDERNKILNCWKKAGKKNEVIALSPGEQKLDYVYIEDVLDGIILAVQKLEQPVITAEGYEAKYALSTEEVYSLKELAEIFEEVYGKKIPVIWGGREYREREVMEPYRRLERLPGWNTKYDFRSGLIKMKESEQVKDDAHG